MSKVVMLCALGTVYLFFSSNPVLASNRVFLESSEKQDKNGMQLADVSSSSKKLKIDSSSKSLKVNKALKATTKFNKKSTTNLNKVLGKTQSSKKKPKNIFVDKNKKWKIIPGKNKPGLSKPGMPKLKIPTKNTHQTLPPLDTPDTQFVPYQYVAPIDPPNEPLETESHQQVIAPVDKPESQQEEGSDTSNDDVIDLLRQVLAQNQNQDTPLVSGDSPQTSMSEPSSAEATVENEDASQAELQLLQKDLEGILKIIKPEENELILGILEIDSEYSDLEKLRLLANYIRKYMESQVE
jgi:hypothetical protein